MTGTPLGVDSEVGTLRTVILHRPGPELQRLTPRNSDALLFDGLPWVARAQDEHDAFAALLRSRGVEVLLLAELLTEALRSGAARVQGIAAAVDSRRLGPHLAQELSAYLRSLEPADLGRVLMAGMTFTEFAASDGQAETSLVRRMHHGGDFVIAPLPNLMFTRDSSVWIGPRFAITSLALPARQRETSLTDLIYAHHPRSPSVWVSAPHPPVRKRWRAACSTTIWPTPSWPCRSRRSARPCTWTPSARWSTPTRW